MIVNNFLVVQLYVCLSKFMLIKDVKSDIWTFASGIWIHPDVRKLDHTATKTGYRLGIYDLESSGIVLFTRCVRKVIGHD